MRIGIWVNSGNEIGSGTGARFGIGFGAGRKAGDRVWRFSQEHDVRMRGLWEWVL